MLFGRDNRSIMKSSIYYYYTSWYNPESWLVDVACSIRDSQWIFLCHALLLFSDWSLNHIVHGWENNSSWLADSAPGHVRITCHAARIVNKRPIGLIAPPSIISFLATGNWPKIKLDDSAFFRTQSYITEICYFEYLLSFGLQKK